MNDTHEPKGSSWLVRVLAAVGVSALLVVAGGLVVNAVAPGDAVPGSGMRPDGAHDHDAHHAQHEEMMREHHAHANATHESGHAHDAHHA